METNDGILLETKDGIKLLCDKFVYRDGSEYSVKDMKSASLKEGKFHMSDSLIIDFKNGASKEFYFKSTTSPTAIMISHFTKGPRSDIMTIQRNIAIQILEWANNINQLINAQGSQPSNEAPNR